MQNTSGDEWLDDRNIVDAAEAAIMIMPARSIYSRGRARPRPALAALAIFLIIASVLATAYFLLGSQPIAKRGLRADGVGGTTSSLATPQLPLPSVDDLILQAIAPDDARSINAKVPFSTEPNPPAAPYFYPSTGTGYERAVDCLAAAVWYEAGDDLVGQQAVAQVVLNRVRHPAFRPSICAVVFQGAERSTGCQFTFTCDGAMARRTPSPVAWQRARAVARLALAGYVFRSVGHATHYHTDWVVPYWSASLDKIVAVGDHLFFRWHGWWGTPGAFSVRPAGNEPAISQLVPLSPVHAANAKSPEETIQAGTFVTEPQQVRSACADGCADDASLLVERTSADTNIILARISGKSDGTRFPALAAALCGARPRCVVMAWTDPTRIPPSLPATTTQLQSMDFHYLRDPALTEARSRWNCIRFATGSDGRCLSHQGLRGVATQPVS